MTDVFDLIVAGGGPAGASAAISAARDGWKVLLLDRDQFPRHKVCGEFVSPESLSLLRWLLGNLQGSLLERAIPIGETRVLLDGRSLRIAVTPAAASIARYDLDLALWNSAQAAGVLTLQKAQVQKIEHGNRFTVTTSAGTFAARAVINASGRWSNLIRRQSAAAVERWLGLKAHCHGEMEIGVDLYFFDGGYCGVQPVRTGHEGTLLNVCALVRQRTAGSFEDVLRCHPLLEQRSRGWRAAYPALSTFPVIFREPKPVCDSLINVGDAAGFVDPFVGDGISLALRGGHLAVRCLEKYFQGAISFSSALHDYQCSYEQSLKPVYRNSSLLRRFLTLPRVLRTPALLAFDKSPGLASYLVDATRSRRLPSNFEA